MTEKKNDDFILVPFDIGENPEKSKCLFRMMGMVVELPPPEFPEKY
jgi:hypothetical protein